MKIAINGLGRIGRAFYKVSLEREIKITAVNDLTPRATLEHLLNFDTVYGSPSEEITLPKEYLSQPDPSKLPWKKLGVALVVESTGRHTKKLEARKHIRSGASKVIISTNSKDADLSVVMGVNQGQYNEKKHHVIAGCSCTTNTVSPVAKILDDHFGIDKAFIATVHSYTSTQSLVDGPRDDLREARAAAANIIPAKTGAAVAVARVLPKLKGKLDGLAYRVPTPAGSIVEVVANLKKKPTVETLNNTFIKEAEGKFEGIVQVTDQPLVSSDILGPICCMIDLNLTRAMGNLVSVKAWYDNEWGYAERLADLVTYIASSQ